MKEDVVPDSPDDHTIPPEPALSRRANPAYGAHLMAYAGIPTFMRQPASRELEGVDVVIVGVPVDSGATSFRSGTRLGPRQIREASALMWGYHPVLDVAPLEILTLCDYGDIFVEPASLEATMSHIVSEMSTVLAAGPLVISLGGDHSITLPLLRAHAAKYGPLAVVHLDAHCDTWDGKIDHSNAFRFALTEGLIDREAYVQVGIRGPVYGADDLQAARRLGAEVLTADHCFEKGLPATIEFIRARMGQRRVYVSLDLDAVDPAYAPGVGTPEVGGFTSYQILQLVRGLRGLNLVGFDLVEVCPPYDAGEITSILAANLAFEFLALVAASRQ